MLKSEKHDVHINCCQSTNFLNAPHFQVFIRRTQLPPVTMQICSEKSTPVPRLLSMITVYSITDTNTNCTQQCHSSHIQLQILDRNFPRQTAAAAKTQMWLIAGPLLMQSETKGTKHNLVDFLITGAAR